MILEEFFDFYLDRTTRDIAARLTALPPGEVEKSASGLAAMFRRSDPEAFEFQVNFYTAMAEIRRDDPAHCIMFDDSGNICYPFFIRYAWERLPGATRNRAGEYFGTDRVEEIIPALTGRREARNWFRINAAPDLKPEDLFAFNEVISLINFSSGGEYSFLDLVYPRIRNLTGKALDAGCGAGVASLLMSRHLEVTGVDACRPRLNRARGMADLTRAGKESLLPRVAALIEDEMGDIFGDKRLPPLRDWGGADRHGLTFVNGSLDDLALGEREFDAVVCLDVLEHTYDPAAVIRQFARVTKPGARLFVTVPNRNGQWYQRMEEEARGATFPAMLHLHHWAPDRLTDLCGRYGFELLQMELFDHLPPDIAGRLTAADRKDLIADEAGFPLQIFAVFQRGSVLS